MTADGSARPRRVTSADVAREAQVSRTTVSFVLNRTPGQVIPEGTRQRVLDAAKRLAYAPSAEARALSRGRSDVVLLYLPPDLPLTPDMGALIEQLSAQFAEAGLLMVAHPWSTRPAAGVWAAVSPAAVLAWDLDDFDADAMRRSGVQVVASLTGSDAIGRWVTGAREDEIARAQVERLVQAGHCHLSYALQCDPRLAAAGTLRYGALQRACGERGLPPMPRLEVPLDRDGAAGALAAWRREQPEVTAVCAHDSTTALAVLSGLRSCGLRTPEDVAVIGANDAAAAAVSDPPLTMVAVDAPATARYMVQVVTGLLRGDGASVEPAPAVTHLVERGSVQPLT